VSAIYDNALDSLRIGFEFFERDRSYSSRKHAILTVFHAIELFFKEQLFQINPILIYKNIDARITDDSLTVGLREILIRFENIGVKIPSDQVAAIERIQKIRNRIEHHRYDHNEQGDDLIIGESLKVILFFNEFVLEKRLGDILGPELFVRMQGRVIQYNERQGLAQHRLDHWMKKQWPEWKEEVEDSPDEFPGTLDCPVCRQDYFVVGYHDKPFCFYCNTSIEGNVCDECGVTFMLVHGCDCGHHAPLKKPNDDVHGVVDSILSDLKTAE
jgi:hypothetical protein